MKRKEVNFSGNWIYTAAFSLKVSMVFEKIRDIISEQLEIDKDNIKPETTFEELGMDSLELFQIIVDMEEAFDIRIEDGEDIKTVDQAVKYVEKQKKNSQGK